MAWCIHRVSLAAHDLAAAATFFGTHLGLGTARRISDDTLAFGAGSRGLRIVKPSSTLSRVGRHLMATTARHVALEVTNLQEIATRLARASLPAVEAPAGDFDTPALYTTDPAGNVVAFCDAPKARAADGEGLQPWERAWGWGVHHVNLQTADVREAVAFYVEIAGFTEGTWRAPAARGNFSIAPTELAVLALDDFNRGLHLIRPDAGFAHRNNFAHNPSIGGHPAFHVRDVKAVKARLESAGTLVSDAHVYAMAGMHQIYVLDPTANMIEVNQFV